MQATLLVPDSHFASVVDLSVGGARVAVDKKLELEVRRPVQLGLSIEVLGKTQELRLEAKVAVVYGVVDTRHPAVAFYGLSFEGLDERLTFMLHGYVPQQLAREYDSLGQLRRTTLRIPIEAVKIDRDEHSRRHPQALSPGRRFHHGVDQDWRLRARRAPALGA